MLRQPFGGQSRCATARAGSGRDMRHRLLALVPILVVLASAPSASARQTDSPPSGDAARAIAWVDANFRRPLGLPDLTWNALIAKAAAAHAKYWTLNGYGTFHEEVPGKPGFTGVEPWDRCAAAGAPDDCGEVAFSGYQLPDAVVGWMDTPYHGEPFLAAQDFGCGESKAGSVCDMDGNSDAFAGQSPDDAAPVNASDSPVRIWPYDGVADVPTTWTGGESPDPLANYTGDENDVGPTLFVGVAENATVTVRDSAGATLPLIAPGATGAQTSLPVAAYPDAPASLRWNALLVARELTPNARYTITVSDSAGRSWQTRFTAQPLDFGLTVDLLPYGATVSTNGGPAKAARVTVESGTGTKLARANVPIGKFWAWPGFRRGGTFVVCADIPETGRYAAAHACTRATRLDASTDGLLQVSPVRFGASTATVTLHVRGALLGRRARVELFASFRGGCGPPCGGWPRSRNQNLEVVLRRSQTFRLPFESGGGWEAMIKVRVASFRRSDTRYEQTLFSKGLGR